MEALLIKHKTWSFSIKEQSHLLYVFHGTKSLGVLCFVSFHSNYDYA